MPEPPSPALRAALAIGLVAVLLPLGASSAIPVTDIKNTLATLDQKLQDKLIALETWALEKLGMEVARDNSEAERAAQIETSMTAAALDEMNDMTRHNLELAERQAPDDDICLGLAVAHAVSGEESVQKRQESVNKFHEFHGRLNERFGENITVYEEDGITPKEVRNTSRAQIEAQNDDARRLAAVCLDPGRNLFDTDTGQSRCLEASMLLSGRRADGSRLAPGSDAAENERDMEALRRQVELLVGPPVALLAPPGTLATNENARVEAARDMRAVLFQKLAATSLIEVMRAHMVPVGEERSLVANLHLYSANRWGSPAWLMKVSNSGEESTSPWQVLRKQASMDAIGMHLNILSYEQRLRMEALNAAMLSLAVQPL